VEKREPLASSPSSAGDEEKVFKGVPSVSVLPFFEFEVDFSNSSPLLPRANFNDDDANSSSARANNSRSSSCDDGRDREFIGVVTANDFDDDAMISSSAPMIVCVYERKRFLLIFENS